MSTVESKKSVKINENLKSPFSSKPCRFIYILFIGILL